MSDIKETNNYIPRWAIELFENYDRKPLNVDDTITQHYQSLVEDAEELIELIENNFTGFSVEFTAPELAEQFIGCTLYLDEVA